MDIYTHTSNLKNYNKYLQLKRLTQDFLQKRKYLELELPLLSPSLVPESYLEIFKTEYRYLSTKQDLFLTPSPELFIKRLMSQGIGDCYYLGKSFRNSERPSERHSSEFTMLEFYKIKADYMDVAREVLALLRVLAGPSRSITYQGVTARLDKWEKLTVDEAFVRFAQLKKGEVFDKIKLRAQARRKGYLVDGFSYEDIFSQMYVQEVEPNLGTSGYATLLYDYPKEFAALAKLNKDNKTAQRFEFYIAGVELGDCYTELTLAKEQNIRFKDEDRKRKESRRINHPIDWGFVKALESGLPDCSGIAIGFDRLAMIFCNATSIHDLRIVDIK